MCVHVCMMGTCACEYACAVCVCVCVCIHMCMCMITRLCYKYGFTVNAEVVLSSHWFLNTQPPLLLFNEFIFILISSSFGVVY